MKEEAEVPKDTKATKPDETPESVQPKKAAKRQDRKPVRKAKASRPKAQPTERRASSMRQIRVIKDYTDHSSLHVDPMSPRSLRGRRFTTNDAPYWIDITKQPSEDFWHIHGIGLIPRTHTRVLN